jgi:hypothetical protein
MNKKTIVLAFGVVLTLIGVLGFVNDPVMGIFEVDSIHNIVHLASGILAIFLAMKGEDGAETFAKAFAVVYGLVTVLGFMMPEGRLLGLMEINMADNFLHLFLTAVFGYVGFVMKKSTRTGAAAA